MRRAAIDALALRLLRRMLAALGNPPLRVELWNGDAIGPADAVGTVRIHDRGALFRMLRDLEVEAGDLYTEGRLSIEGDLVALLRVALATRLDASFTRWLPRRLVERSFRNDSRAARGNAQHHYDVGNEFYALWLDERMVYTCAYFPTPQDSLEDAQLAKMDHVCRKVALRPGERVIEAGCGWGALALHMARYYGATVRAFNVSHEQILYAREQAEKQGLAQKVEFVEDDYRNIGGRCDKFVSVGMLEHVGVAHYPALARVIEHALEPHGLALIHTIGRSRPQRLSRWIGRRIFPNAYAPTLREMMDLFEPFEFAVLDIENLRRHYALTLRHWLARYQRSYSRVVELVGSRIARAWQLYLAGSVGSFENGALELFQVVFTRAHNSRVPWTRAHLYSQEAPEFGPEGEVRVGAL